MFLIAPLLMAVTLAANTNQMTTAYTGVRPVKIDACSVKPSIAGYAYSNDDNGAYAPDGVGEKLKIKFANSTNKQISSVTFAVSDGTKHVTNVVDAGKFSPGIIINHYFQSHVPDTRHLACSVSSVAFSDGSTWMGPLTTVAMK